MKINEFETLYESTGTGEKSMEFSYGVDISWKYLSTINALLSFPGFLDDQNANGPTASEVAEKIDLTPKQTGAQLRRMAKAGIIDSVEKPSGARKNCKMDAMAQLGYTLADLRNPSRRKEIDCLSGELAAEPNRPGRGGASYVRTNNKRWDRFWMFFMSGGWSRGHQGELTLDIKCDLETLYGALDRAGVSLKQWYYFPRDHVTKRIEYTIGRHGWDVYDLRKAIKADEDFDCRWIGPNFIANLKAPQTYEEIQKWRAFEWKVKRRGYYIDDAAKVDPYA